MNNFWNETIWKGINDEVRKVAGTIRVAQKVFPTIILDNPSNIPDDTFDLANDTIFEGLTKPLVEISTLFKLTPNQVANEASLQTALKLAKLRASDLARIEDLIIFQGNNAYPPPQPGMSRFPKGENVRNLTKQSVGTGLLGVATDPIDGTFPPNPPIGIPLLVAPQPGVQYGENTLAAVVKGIGVLNGKSQPGPFALILDYRIVADAYSVLGGTLTTTADLLTPLVTGGLFGTAALPGFTGLLVSLGGAPITIYLGVEATAAFATKSDIEDYRFRVFERVQFDARDPRALVRLNFAPVILKLNPDNGLINVSTPVVIEIIEGFSSGRIKSVQFGPSVIQPGGNVAAGQFEVVDDAHIRLLSPLNANAVAVDVTVTSLDDLTSNPVKFTYKP
jgi:uncharacterized linocin/CFP29 family protein